MMDFVGLFASAEEMVRHGALSEPQPVATPCAVDTKAPWTASAAGMQDPLPGRTLHATNPGLHVHEHAPLLHVDVAFGTLQTEPQDPQLFRSVWRLSQVLLPLQ
jgi:hypothetical protein